MNKTLTIGGGIVLAVVLLVWGLASSIKSALLDAGIPAESASDIGSVVFFGVLVGLVVLAIKAIPRLSRV